MHQYGYQCKQNTGTSKNEFFSNNKINFPGDMTSFPVNSRKYGNIEQKQEDESIWVSKRREIRFG